MIKAVLFDFDGTLVDTRSASWELFALTNRAFSLGIDTQEKFFRIFEGNFYESLAHHCRDPQLTASVSQHFLHLIRTRYTPPFINGVAELVRRLAAAHLLAILSSNVEDTIRRLLRGAALEHCFAHVLAGDNQPSKALAIENFLATQALQPNDVVLVTDTVGDVNEARASGIRALGVDWGMHDAHKLLAAGATCVAHRPDELFDWITLACVSAREQGASATP